MTDRAEVVVVGAGPGGCAVAIRLARAGHRVVLLERGSGPTDDATVEVVVPPAVSRLRELGVEAPPEAHRLRGLRLVAAGSRRHIPWPYRRGGAGVVWNRSQLLAALRELATASGVDVRTGWNVTAVLRAAAGRPRGVQALTPAGVTVEVLAHEVVLAIGARSSGAGPWPRRAGTTFAAPLRHDDSRLEVWLELPVLDDAGRRRIVPGCGWVLGCGDGTADVGVRTTSRVDAAGLLHAWVATLPPEWEIRPDTMVGPVRAVDQQPTGLADAGKDIADAPVPTLRGVFHPLTGEGLTTSLAAADLLARGIVTSLSGNGSGQEAAPGAGWRSRKLLRTDTRAMASAVRTFEEGFSWLAGHRYMVRLATRCGLPYQAATRGTAVLITRRFRLSGVGSGPVL